MPDGKGIALFSNKKQARTFGLVSSVHQKNQ